MSTSSLPATYAQDATPFCGSHHRWPDDIAGYVVVLTRFGEGKLRDDSTYEVGNYGKAVGRAHVLRLASGPEVDWDYARIDVIYADGCRGIL